MSGAVNQRFDRGPAAHEQGADSFRCINFVAGYRQKIDTQFVSVSRNLADRLGRVSVEQDAVLAGNSGTSLDRLDCADFIVGMHNAYENRLGGDRCAKVVGVNPAGTVDGQVAHSRTQTFEKPARFDDRRVLDPRGDDVVALVAKRKEYAFQGQIIGFAPATCENNLIVPTAEQGCDLTTGCFKRRLCRGRRPMSARRIAIIVVEKRLHYSGNGRIDWRTRVVIEIDALWLHASSLMFTPRRYGGSLRMNKVFIAVALSLLLAGAAFHWQTAFVPLLHAAA
jgi:hypothetical protein